MTAFFKFRCDGCDTPLISTIRTAKLSINVPRMTITKPCPVCRKTPIEALGGKYIADDHGVLVRVGDYDAHGGRIK